MQNLYEIEIAIRQFNDLRDSLAIVDWRPIALLSGSKLTAIWLYRLQNNAVSLLEARVRVEQYITENTKSVTI